MAVNYRKKQEQYKHQISYFGKEFSRIKQYKLDPWMLTYIDRLKKYLLDKNFKKLYRFFYYKVLSREKAEDLTSETFLIFVEQIQKRKDTRNSGRKSQVR